MLDLSHMIQDMTNTNKNPDTTEMENLLNEDYKETMQGRTEERKNRFTGQSILLTKEEAEKHDALFMHELMATIEDKKLGTRWRVFCSRCRGCYYRSRC